MAEKTVIIKFSPGDKVETNESGTKLCGGRKIVGLVDSVNISEYSIQYNVLYNRSETGMDMKITSFPAFALKKVTE